MREVMTKRKRLYILLLSCVLLQVVIMRYIRWAPDLILVAVVFAGIFYGFRKGFEIGLAAGFLRGMLSSGTITADVFIFSGIGLISALLAHMFYRQNPVMQVATITVAVFAMVLFHTLYLNFVHSNDVRATAVFVGSWRPITATICFSPFLFAFLKRLFRIDTT